MTTPFIQGCLPARVPAAWLTPHGDPQQLGSYHHHQPLLTAETSEAGRGAAWGRGRVVAADGAGPVPAASQGAFGKGVLAGVVEGRILR